MLFDCGGYWLEVLGGSSIRDLVINPSSVSSLKKKSMVECLRMVQVSALVLRVCLTSLDQLLGWISLARQRVSESSCLRVDLEP